jgi:hypothetical protein
MKKLSATITIASSIISIFIGMNISSLLYPPRRIVLLEPLKDRDRKFFNDLNSENKELGKLIRLYKGFAILGGRDLIYDLRDEEYRKVVSREVEKTLGPKNQIFEGVYFDPTNFRILDDYAKFSVSYFTRDENGHDSINTVDEYWMFDEADKKWKFLSSPYNGNDVLGRDREIAAKFTSGASPE